ncbi:MAG TPA: periplasmic heavy metal sensor [Candidatus Angelobacter sp.]|nr:periplasmic heavy metal sensor [Candidatus Angelobacter sp.]
MKRSAFILVLGLLLAAGAYYGFYFLSAAPSQGLTESKAPELAWLKKEFNLSDAELARVSELHAAYRPHCVEMCHRIDAKNAELKDLLAKTNTMTPDVEKKLAEAAQLRLECQQAMLRHFMEVSRTMPPDQGRRYLAWVEERTFLPGYGMRQDDSMEHAP